MDEAVKFLDFFIPELRKIPFLGGGLAILLLWNSQVSADMIWRGDFESQGLQQWSGLNHEKCIDLVDEPVLQGRQAGRISITDDDEHIWSNGLNRVEFRYEPGAGATAEGEDLYFGWSFMLPELLSEDNHQIAYWESEGSYHQVMAFVMAGPLLRFITQEPGYAVHWLTREIVPSKWYDLAMHIHWSKQESIGLVSAWLDGVQVVNEVRVPTLYDDNAHFIQLGILRDTIEKNEEIYIDNARHGSSLEDVLGARVPGPGELPVDGKIGSGGGSDAQGQSQGGCALTVGQDGYLWEAFLLALVGLVARRRYKQGRALEYCLPSTRLRAAQEHDCRG